MNSILIIQTAFIGDAILITPVIENLAIAYPNAEIDLVVRKGNESLFNGHPLLKNVFCWDKKNGKTSNLIKLGFALRKKKYDLCINAQRFLSTGILTMLINADQKIGFKKNPLSIFFSKRISHIIGEVHETDRNNKLIEDFCKTGIRQPRLYPQDENFNNVKHYSEGKYITISPASVWFTKQFPKEKWIELINLVPDSYTIYLLGSNADRPLCESIQKEAQKAVISLAGKLSFLDSAALMKNAIMNFTNDSAPLHIASSINAPVTAIYCSTIPDFGFGPLSEQSFILENTENLSCRPCGLHGRKSCPEEHFNCAMGINISDAIKNLDTD